MAIQSATIFANSSLVIPAWVAATICRKPFSPSAASALRSSSSTALNGCFFFQSGCRGASAFTRSIANMIWKYIGCSDHSVPSLSKVAMRWSTGTKSGAPGVVTRGTKSVIDFFAAPSFQEGRGSVWARAKLSIPPHEPTASTKARNVRRNTACAVPCIATSVCPSLRECIETPAGGWRPALCRNRQPPCDLEICSRAWSTLKLEGFCRGGKSLNVSTNCATNV